MTDTVASQVPLPVRPTGSRSTGWYGMLLLIASEAALFIYLLFSYFYLGSQSQGAWPPGGPPALGMASLNTALLLASSGTAWWGQKGIERGSPGRLLLGLWASLGLGALFVAIQAHEWTSKSFTPADNAYGSLYFTVTGLHIAHVVVGLIILACLILWTSLGRFSAQRHDHVSIGVLYWHFVDAVWLAVFATLFLTPRLGLT